MNELEIRSNLIDLLIDGLEELINIGSNSSFWGATRANSDAVLALTICLPQYDFYKLKSRCLERISNEGNESDTLVNWDEEIWDTSIAIMALSTEYETHKIKIQKALNWINSKYIIPSQSWNEEVWETLLALNAITYSKSKSQKNTNDCNKYFEGSINWIASLYNTPRKGILVNWSSTALYLLFAINVKKFNLGIDNNKILDEHIHSSCEQILLSNISISEEILWTSETWSNGLVLWAISEAKRGTFEDGKLGSILSWFRGKILLKDTPIEDKAFACVGLYKYLEYLEIVENHSKNSVIKVRENLQANISRYINLRVKDFIPNPPFFDKSYHYDYYTINLNKRVANITLILIITVVLTYLSVRVSKESEYIVKWLSIIPALLGVLATITQLLNFNIIPTKKRDRKDAK
jgi:hypothetical protein